MTDTTYKSDARSIVWRQTSPAGDDVVIKRWQYSPLRQRLGRLLGLHPAQREIRWNRRLIALGLPVVPILQHTRHRGRSQLHTPHIGPSLQQALRSGELSFGAKRAIARQLADAVADLFDHELSFRDMKTSNVLLDDAGKLHWIDVGSFRRVSPDRIMRSLALLDHTAAGDGATRTDRLRFARHLAARMHRDARGLIADVCAHPH